MAAATFNVERVYTVLAGFWLGLAMNGTGTAVIALSDVAQAPSGGKLCGTTELVRQGRFLQGLVRQGMPLATIQTLYWTGTDVPGGGGT